MRRSERNPSAGFTLVEMMIAVSILGIVLAGVLGLVLGAQNEYVRQRDVNRSQDALRTAETVITTALRSARADPYETGGALLDPDPSGDGAFDDLRVVSDFNPADGDMDDPLEDVQFRVDSDSLKARWEAGGSFEVLAHPVESLGFTWYDGNDAVISSAGSVESDAVKVRVELRANRGPASSAPDRLESWVHLRNSGVSP